MNIEYNKMAVKSIAEETSQMAALVQLASNQLLVMHLEEQGKPARPIMTLYQLHSLLEMIDLKLLDRYESFMDDFKKCTA